jgi:hypothetical protein
MVDAEELLCESAPTSRQCIGGVTRKKAQQEWTGNGRLGDLAFNQSMNTCFHDGRVRHVCLFLASQEEIPVSLRVGQIVAGADGKFPIGHDSCDLAYALSYEKQVTRNRRSSQL